MPLIAQICMVVVTIALLVVAVMAVRVMLQIRGLIQTANLSLAELPGLLEETKRASARAEELLIAFTRITRSAQVAVSQFEGLATRSSALTTALLDEVERPVTHVVGMIRGIQVGANHLLRRWKSRAESRSNTNEGEEHVGEQQWFDDGGAPGGSGDRGRTGAGVRANGR
jgi:hypothetical protein